MCPYLWTCENNTFLTSWNEAWIPLIIDITKDGVGERPARARKTLKESPSNVNSCNPTSLANYRPIWEAFASTYKGLKGALIFLLKATTTRPLASQIIAHTPDSLWAFILQLNNFYWGKLKHNIGNELPFLTYRVLYVLYLYTESTNKIWN